MSTSLLYNGLGLIGYEYVGTRYRKGTIVFRMKAKRSSLNCSVCGYLEVVLRGTKRRTFRTVPLGSKAVWLEVEVQRVFCRRCKQLRQAKLGLAEPNHQHTRAFARYALELSRHTTIQDAADHLGVSWDTVKDIQKEYLQKRFKAPKLRHLKWIAIDEICVGHGYRYLSVVLDLKSGAVVYVGDGKGGEALEPFWKRLRASRARVSAVAIDMSAAYIKAVTDNLPKAQIVFDHFHIIKLYNEKLSDLRRALYHEVTTLRQKKVLKESRWLLLKNPDNLDPKRNEKKRIEEALKLNEPLALAYIMKERCTLP